MNKHLIFSPINYFLKVGPGIKICDGWNSPIKYSDFSSVIDVINPSISVNDNDNDIPTAPFTKAEFRDAIFSMHPDKCSGPDGYSPGFYQHFWTLCSDDIFKECCDWLDTRQFPPDLNITNIALITKGSTQVSMKD